MPGSIETGLTASHCSHISSRSNLYEKHWFDCKWLPRIVSSCRVPSLVLIRGMRAFSGKMETTGGEQNTGTEMGTARWLGHRCVRTWIESRKRINRTYPCRLHLYSAGTAAFARSIRGVLAEVPFPPLSSPLLSFSSSWNFLSCHNSSVDCASDVWIAFNPSDPFFILPSHHLYWRWADFAGSNGEKGSCGDGGRLG